MRLRLTIAYDGSRWEGWQLQRPPALTIQGALEQAFYTLTRKNCRVLGAGRTDSGVHALGQTAHVDVPERQWDWRERLNAVLPRDVTVVSALEASPEFHARRDALSKMYFYNFWPERKFMDPRLCAFAWACGPLDVQAMREAAALFLGEHDFASFQNSGTDVKSTVRHIYSISLTEMPVDSFLPPHTPLLRLEICGNGFLKQMVRNIAGFLTAVGRRKISPLQLTDILAANSRSALPTATVPAHGLFLAKVYYKSH